MDHHSSPSHQALSESDKPYAPHDVLDETIKTAVVGLGGGFFLAAIRNAMAKRNVGAMGVFTRGAPIIGICGMNDVLSRTPSIGPVASFRD
jgi:hypothetical protein